MKIQILGALSLSLSACEAILPMGPIGPYENCLMIYDEDKGEQRSYCEMETPNGNKCQELDGKLFCEMPGQD